MVKFRLTETSNFLLCLVGILFSLGFLMDYTAPYTLFAFGIMASVCFLYRTKYAYLNYISIAISFIFYVLEFGYSNSLFFGFHVNNTLMVSTTVLSIGLFVINGTFNFLLMRGKLSNAKK